MFFSSGWLAGWFAFAFSFSFIFVFGTCFFVIGLVELEATIKMMVLLEWCCLRFEKIYLALLLVLRALHVVRLVGGEVVRFPILVRDFTRGLRYWQR